MSIMFPKLPFSLRSAALAAVQFCFNSILSILFYSIHDVVLPLTSELSRNVARHEQYVANKYYVCVFTIILRNGFHGTDRNISE